MPVCYMHIVIHHILLQVDLHEAAMTLQSTQPRYLVTRQVYHLGMYTKYVVGVLLQSL